MKKILLIFLFTIFSVLLSSCTPQDFGATGNCGWTGCPEGATTSSSPGAGQYTKATSVGENKFMIKGFSSSDAIKGAQVHCNNLGKKMELDNLNDDKVAIFKCI